MYSCIHPILNHYFNFAALQIFTDSKTGAINCTPLNSLTCKVSLKPLELFQNIIKIYMYTKILCSNYRIAIITLPRKQLRGTKVSVSLILAGEIDARSVGV